MYDDMPELTPVMSGEDIDNFYLKTFNLADADGDGQLSLAEFVQAQLIIFRAEQQYQIDNSHIHK